jgi:hypothetical protein
MNVSDELPPRVRLLESQDHRHSPVRLDPTMKKLRLDHLAPIYAAAKN